MTQFSKKIFRQHSGEQDVFIVISDGNQLEQVITEGLQLVPLNLFDSFYCGLRSNTLNLTIAAHQLKEFLEFLEILAGFCQQSQSGSTL